MESTLVVNEIDAILERTRRALSQNQTQQCRSVNRLSGLLDRIRRNEGRRRKKCGGRYHRIQIRWIHYNSAQGRFDPVRQKNGGGNRFIEYSDTDPLTIEDTRSKAADVFFPGGENDFAGTVLDMRLEICDATRKVIDHFPGDGTLSNYLVANGLYPSTTYLYLKSKPWSLCKEMQSSTNASPVAQKTPQLLQPPTIYQTNHMRDQEAAASSHHTVDAQPLNSFSTDTLLICQVCSCSYEEGSFCARCFEGEEFEELLQGDGGYRSLTEPPTSPQAVPSSLTDIVTASPPPLNNQDVDGQAALGADNTLNSRQLAEEANPSAAPSVSSSESNLQQRHTIKLLTVHRSRIKSDMIEHFKDPSVLSSHLIFNYVELREEFTNILKKENGWEMDIM